MSDLELVDDYLGKWDRFAQGESDLVSYIRDNAGAFEATLARIVRGKDICGPARLVFYAIVQVGGFIQLDSDLGKASAALLGSNFPVFTSKVGTQAYFAGELYFWWRDNCDKYAAFPLFEEWKQREFARTIVIPMYESTCKRK